MEAFTGDCFTWLLPPNHHDPLFSCAPSLSSCLLGMGTSRSTMCIKCNPLYSKPLLSLLFSVLCSAQLCSKSVPVEAERQRRIIRQHNSEQNSLQITILFMILDNTIAAQPYILYNCQTVLLIILHNTIANSAVPSHTFSLLLFCNNPTIILNNNPTIILYNNPKIILYNNPTIILYNNPTIVLYNNPRIILNTCPVGIAAGKPQTTLICNLNYFSLFKIIPEKLFLKN